VSTLLTRLFPTPSFVTIPTVGLDFSDATMRYIELKEGVQGLLPSRFAEMAIPEGCMQGGKITNEEKFTAFLHDVKKKNDLTYVRVSMPESQVYSFTLPLDAAAAGDIRGAIEFVLEDNIPLKAIETIFDYHILSNDEKSIIVQVVAVSELVSQSYFNCFMNAGLIPVSFELDGQAITRAVLKPDDTGSFMIVDFGANRTSMTIVTNGTAVYTSTLEFGGKTLTQSLAKELNITFDEAQQLKHQYGLSAVGEHKNIFSTLMGGISTLKDEINRRYVYWHERKNQVGSFPDIKTIYLCGGHSNLRGLADYLSVSLKLEVVQVNPWINCVSFDDAIPTMPYEISMSYVTTIGLALTDYIYD
jgi:type IV pilus assembly protein PilM